MATCLQDQNSQDQPEQKEGNVGGRGSQVLSRYAVWVLLSLAGTLFLIACTSMAVTPTGAIPATVDATVVTTPLSTAAPVVTAAPESAATAEATAAPSTVQDGTETPVPTSTSGNLGGGPPAGGMMTGGAIDKSDDAVLQEMIAEVVPRFQQFEYTDTETGLTLPYNLYIAADYDPSVSYPLVLFIADSSVVGRDVTAPLTQGYGGLIWATEAEQAKRATFVLVPQYPEVIIDDHDGFATTDYVELTVRLLNSIMEQYNIDENRIYGTGQSMGAMTILLLSVEHPDLFAAELIVSGQWDIGTLGKLATQKFFYIAAAGDPKASVGQTEVEAMLDSAEVDYSTATWNAKWSSDEFAAAVASILSEGNDINIATFEEGTVLPEGTAAGTNEHMYSFDYAYKIEGVRDWLFEQTNTNAF